MRTASETHRCEAEYVDVTLGEGVGTQVWIHDWIWSLWDGLQGERLTCGTFLTASILRFWFSFIRSQFVLVFGVAMALLLFSQTLLYYLNLLLKS